MLSIYFIFNSPCVSLYWSSPSRVIFRKVSGALISVTAGFDALMIYAVLVWRIGMVEFNRDHLQCASELEYLEEMCER